MYYTFFPVYNHGALYSRFSSSAPLVLSTSISDSRPVTSLPSQLSQAHLDGHPPISPTPTLMHDIYHLYLLLVPTLIARLLVIVPTFRSSRSSVELFWITRVDLSPDSSFPFSPIDTLPDPPLHNIVTRTTSKHPLTLQTANVNMALH